MSLMDTILANEDWSLFWVPVAEAATKEEANAAVWAYVKHHGIADDYDGETFEVHDKREWMRNVDPEAEFGWLHCRRNTKGAIEHWVVSL